MLIEVDDSIEILLKEYESLRQECLSAMTNRTSVLSFGLAVVGAILAALSATIKEHGNSPLPGLILTLLIPLIANFVLFMWLGEYQRSQRAGKFLAGLEYRINHLAALKLLSWETTLRNQHRKMHYPYIAAILLLELISFGSFTAGVFIFNACLPDKSATITWIWFSIMVGLITHILAGAYVQYRISKLYA